MNNVKKITIIAGVIVGFVSLLAIVAAIFGQKQLEIVNFDQVESSLSGKERDELENYVYQTLKNGKIIEENESGIKATIRGSSYVEKKEDDVTQYDFLVDIDDKKMTYQVDFAMVDGQGFYESPIIECPEPSSMKYPETNCVGGRTSTMSVTLGKYLPYYFHLDSGQFVTVTTSYSEDNPNNLNVRVSSCGDEEIINEVRKDVEDWILELGYEPERYNINIPAYCDGAAD